MVIDPSNGCDIEPAGPNEHLGSSLEPNQLAILVIVSVNEEPSAIVVVERDITVSKEQSEPYGRSKYSRCVSHGRSSLGSGLRLEDETVLGLRR